MAVALRSVEKDRYTEEEYFAFEQTAFGRWEYVNGEIRAMSGGTPAHSAIAMGLGSALVGPYPTMIVGATSSPARSCSPRFCRRQLKAKTGRPSGGAARRCRHCSVISSSRPTGHGLKSTHAPRRENGTMPPVMGMNPRWR